MPDQRPLTVQGRGIALVAATYFYFLLFAQYGFVRLVRSRLEPLVAGQPWILGSMAVLGLVTSAVVARLLRQTRPETLLRTALLSCGLVAIAATVATAPWALALIAAGIGAAVALLTVTLASHLRQLVPGPRFGLAVGAGTGIAYFASNLPFLFEASPELQATVAAAVVWSCLLLIDRRAREPAPVPVRLRSAAKTALLPADFRTLGVISVVLSFLALVWLDSAAFNIIQESATLKAVTWGSGGGKLLLGTVHCLAAMAAGAWIDRGRFHTLLAAAFALFVVAFRLLDGGGSLAGPLYAIGISFYSVALVVYPSYRGDEPGLVPRRLRAAAVYGISGWLGSVLGVGMAQELASQNLATIPVPFLLIAGAVLVAASLLRLQGGPRLARIYAPLLLIALLVLALDAGAAALRPDSTELDPTELDATAPQHETTRNGAVERGRKVYINEGCVNCHSQFVRRGTADEELWGPWRDTQETRTGEPPLFGNRRQGPDLTSVGNRRSSAWQRLHLEMPWLLSPGSRMPSYWSLFDDERGEDLVAYLMSLGAETVVEHFERTLHAPVPEAVLEHRGDPTRGGQHFATYCEVCHGVAGAGNGPASASLDLRPGERQPPSLRRETLAAVSWGPELGSFEEGLARVIRYGIPGTSMPGHETLSDREIADLVAFVEALPDDEAKKPPANVANVEELFSEAAP